MTPLDDKTAAPPASARPAPGDGAVGGAAATAQVVSLSVYRFEGVFNRLWAFGQMAASRGPLSRHPDIGFFRLFGTGTREGFHPAPNFGVYAVLATWPDFERARLGQEATPAFAQRRARAAERWTVYLSPISSRGRWGGVAPFDAPERRSSDDDVRPIAVLTRATLKLRHLQAFWRRTPDIGADIRGQTALRFKIGMGEVPWRNQVTFSIWDNTEAMRTFAYTNAAHAEAVRAMRDGDWFHEELFARFRVLGAEGTWDGHAPLAPIA